LGIITDESAASEDFTWCTALKNGAEGTLYTLFISEADVDRVDTTEGTLLLSNLQAETEEKLQVHVKSETLSYITARELTAARVSS
jgi:hypothetical protein